MTRPAAASRLGLPGLRRRPVRSTDATGDQAAFEAVYRDCHQDLYRYAHSIVRNEHAAEDVLQGTMERALIALQEETRDFELRPWLFRIVHNEAINRLRRDKPTVELPETVLASAPPVAEQLDDKQTLDRLWVDLGTLPERQRQALVLRELSGLGHDEIGEVLGTSGRAVKQTIFEARRALLDCSEGREMLCDDVQRSLSDGDGRVRRGRRMQSHLRSCRDCRAFDLALNERPDQLRALAPVLPVAVAAAVLGQLAPGVPAAALGHVGGATAGWSLGSIGGALVTKAAVIAVASATVIGGAGVAAVELRDAPTGRPSGAEVGPDSGSGNVAGSALGGAPATGTAGANGASTNGEFSSTTADPDRERDPKPTSPGSQGDAQAAAEGAAGKARAAENRAAAARRRAAAAERRANAGKGNNGKSSTAGSNGKSKSGSTSSGKKPTTTSSPGKTDTPATKAPTKKAPAAPAPAAQSPAVKAPESKVPAAKAPETSSAPGGGAQAAPPRPDDAGRPQK